MDSIVLEISVRGLHRYETIRPGVTRIGRALDNDIILSDPTVAPHHFKIICHPDDSIELINLAAVNPTRVDDQAINSRSIQQLPVQIELGRVQAQLLPRDHPVAPTRPLAGKGNGRHLFGHARWAMLLVLACLLVGGLEFFLNIHNSFKWIDLLKFLLRETILSIGAFVLALAILERLLVNRWEIRQLVTSVCLVYLLYYFCSLTVDQVSYLFSASWPTTLFRFGWFLAIIPGAIALYLVNISHLKRSRSIWLAMLIASPIAVPSILQSTELRGLLDDFSSAAKYQNNLSSLNWHLKDTVTIDEFIEQARQLDAGKFAD